MAFLFGWFYATLHKVNFAIAMRSLKMLPVIALLTGMLLPVSGNDPDSLGVLIVRDSVSESQAGLRLELAREISNEDISRAIELAQEAMDQAIILGSPGLEAEARLSIGRFYDYLGVRQEALDL